MSLRPTCPSFTTGRWWSLAEVVGTQAGAPDVGEHVKGPLGLEAGQADAPQALHQVAAALREIQATIAKIDPLPGAREFLDALRAETQVIILSDTFEQFAKPLMEKLGWPTIFCNTLEVAPDGAITGYRMRCPQSKLTTVRALQYRRSASGSRVTRGPPKP